LGILPFDPLALEQQLGPPMGGQIQSRTLWVLILYNGHTLYTLFNKKRDEGKIKFSIYFNGQSPKLTGFMLIHGKPEHLMEGGEDLERHPRTMKIALLAFPVTWELLYLVI
jgi:hypothetical protein